MGPGDDVNSSDSCFTLYLEYLGGLVPLLKGKRISRIKPEFVIYDPKKIQPKTKTKGKSGRNKFSA